MSDLTRLAQAYQRARERSFIVVGHEMTMLHFALEEARKDGLTIRQAADVLNAPKSTVARHWREDHRCAHSQPILDVEQIDPRSQRPE